MKAVIIGVGGRVPQLLGDLLWHESVFLNSIGSGTKPRTVRTNVFVTFCLLASSRWAVIGRRRPARINPIGFVTTIEPEGKTATGFRVAIEVVEVLGSGKKPCVRKAIGAMPIAVRWLATAKS